MYALRQRRTSSDMVMPQRLAWASYSRRSESGLMFVLTLHGACIGGVVRELTLWAWCSRALRIAAERERPLASVKASSVENT